MGFPGDPVVRNLLSNAGDTDLIPAWGTKIPHSTGQLSPRASARKLSTKSAQSRAYALPRVYHN